MSAQEEIKNVKNIGNPLKNNSIQLTVFAGVSEVRPLTSARECMPQIRACAIRMTRIRYALLAARTTGLYIRQICINFVALLLREDPFAVDNNILHAANKA